MAKLYINKDIVADKDKMVNWYLTGDEGMSFSDVRGFLEWMSPEDGRVEIELHSCGGRLDEGYAMYDALRATGKEISSKVVGKCASMATVLLLAAPSERRTAFENAQFLIHAPYYPSGKAGMNADDLREAAESLDKDTNKMIDIYVERTGAAREEIEKQMKNGDWFDATRALELGFISSIVKPASASASNSHNDNNMDKSKRQEVWAALKGLSAVLGFGKEEDAEPVAKTITTSTGDKLKIERDKGDAQVGDKASPDGSHVLENGKTIVVSDGKITSITEPKEDKKSKKAEGEDNVRIAQLEKELADMKAAKESVEAENATLKASALGEEDNEMLAAVRDAGGMDFLAKVASTYTPAGRAGGQGNAGKAKDENGAPQGKFQERLAQMRENNKKGV